MQQARTAIGEGSGEWIDILKRAFKASKIIRFNIGDDFISWCDDHRLDARDALLELWSGQDGIEKATRAFLTRVPTGVIRESYTGTRAALASFLAMAIDPGFYPPYQPTAFATAYDLTGHPRPNPGADAAEVYRHGLEFIDTISTEASNRGLELGDRMGAQLALWLVVKSGDWYREILPEAEHESFLAYREGNNGESTTPPTPVDPPDRTLKSVAAELHYDDASDLEAVERLLDDKRQVVFFGPPGTGKTYVAQKLAEYFAGEHGSVDLVQFHPSYAYEDFIEGYRPALINGQPGFRVERRTSQADRATGVR